MKTLRLVAMAMLMAGTAGATEYWTVSPENHSIVWNASDALPHSDHVEMAGRQIACVLRYGVDADKHFHINKSFVWPTLRTVPNDTHASLMRRMNLDAAGSLIIDGKPIVESVSEIEFNGVLNVRSDTGRGVTLSRRYTPSPDKKAFVEEYSLVNHGPKEVTVEIPDLRYTLTTPETKGVDGEYVIEGVTGGASTLTLCPGDSCGFSFTVAARRRNEPLPEVNVAGEFSRRHALIGEWMDALRLETPDTVLNSMFDFSKIRACESIYQTKGGPLHGPGGEKYYAAIWANDQAEYANPFFPFTGYAYAGESAENSFMHFARYMNDEYKPIPSSIIAEGDSYWNGAGDRGDAAMIAYGAARYALANGDREAALRLWPLVDWCLEYCHRRLNAGGTVSSDSDELENRFPSGDANLCTSSLYYDALISAAYLAQELGMPKAKYGDLRQRAANLHKAINEYFQGPVEGFDTYAYYKGNTLLRSWICIPLTVGIYEKAEPTVRALFSDRLWSDNGLLTQSNDATYWDRSTLYALRGILQAGYVDEAMKHLSFYSRTRLLGEHVPYAIEAWPEGNQRHLSAESALYARVITEGLFGIRPVGFRSFDLLPRLPQGWSHMALRNIRAFRSQFDVEVTEVSLSKCHVRVTEAGKLIADKTLLKGTPLRISLPTNRR